MSPVSQQTAREISSENANNLHEAYSTQGNAVHEMLETLKSNKDEIERWMRILFAQENNATNAADELEEINNINKPCFSDSFCNRNPSFKANESEGSQILLSSTIPKVAKSSGNGNEALFVPKNDCKHQYKPVDLVEDNILQKYSKIESYPNELKLTKHSLKTAENKGPCKDEEIRRLKQTIKKLDQELVQCKNRFNIIESNLLILGEQKASWIDNAREKQSQLDFCSAELEATRESVSQYRKSEENMKKLHEESMKKFREKTEILEKKSSECEKLKSNLREVQEHFQNCARNQEALREKLNNCERNMAEEHESYLSDKACLKRVIEVSRNIFCHFNVLLSILGNGNLDHVDLTNSENLQIESEVELLRYPDPNSLVILPDKYCDALTKLDRNIEKKVEIGRACVRDWKLQLALEKERAEIILRESKETVDSININLEREKGFSKELQLKNAELEKRVAKEEKDSKYFQDQLQKTIFETEELRTKIRVERIKEKTLKHRIFERQHSVGWLAESENLQKYLVSLKKGVMSWKVSYEKNKITRKYKMKPRSIQLTENGEHLMIHKNNKTTKIIPVKSVVHTGYGEKSSSFYRANEKHPRIWLCYSIYDAERSYDFIFDTENSLEAVILGLCKAAMKFGHHLLGISSIHELRFRRAMLKLHSYCSRRKVSISFIFKEAIRKYIFTTPGLVAKLDMSRNLQRLGITGKATLHGKENTIVV